MKKLIKIDFDNTTRERKTEDSYSELYSHDKNNGSFEFEILNDTLTTEQVIALFKFTESNKIWKTTGTVEGNKVKVTFDTSLITQNETVICYLYFDEEQRTSDTFRFKFKVKVSEIDKISRYEVKERFINNTVIVDRLDVVTKTELQEALKNVGGISTEGLLTEVKAEGLYAKKSEAVDNTNFELVKNRILALELKTDKDTVYDDSEVKERLTTLENKQPVDLSNYATKEELRNISGSQPTVDTSNLVTREELTAKNFLTEHQSLDNLVTKQELEEKHYLTTHQDLSEYAKKSELYNDASLKERVMALENKAIEGGAYDDKPIRDRLDVLEAKHDNDTIYDDTEVKRRLTEIESKPTVDTSVFVTDEKLASKGYLTEHQSLDNLVTKEELNSKGYVSDEVLSGKGYLTEETLNSKNYLTEDVLNTKNYLTQHQDLSSLVTKQELENKHFLTEHQPLTHLATTSDLEALRNIAVSKSELSKKVDTTEYNTLKDTVVTKDELAGKNYLTEHQNLDGYVKKSELGTLQTNQTLSLNNNTLSISGGNSIELPLNRYEIHGTGMPNGVVEAEIGTTYVDKNKTNGALKWIKTTNGGNTGWRVFTGDTGWRTLPLINKRGDAKLQIRRINDEVIVKFDGLQWGWFGVDDLEKQDGNIVEKTIGSKKYTWIKLNVGRGNEVLPGGFRSASSLLSGLYGDLGDLLGSVYVGGTDDSNAIQLRYAMTRNELTSDILSQIRISPITFITDDEWPVQLP